MKPVITLPILILLILLALFFIGYTSHKPYRATMMTVVNQPYEKVYHDITNIWVFPLLYNQAIAVELVEGYTNENLRWIEYDARNKPWMYEFSGAITSNRMAISLIPNRMYSEASWVIQIQGNSNTTDISITEESRFRNWWHQLRGLLYGRNKGLQMKLEQIDRFFKSEKD